MLPSFVTFTTALQPQHLTSQSLLAPGAFGVEPPFLVLPVLDEPVDLVLLPVPCLEAVEALFPLWLLEAALDEAPWLPPPGPVAVTAEPTAALPTFVYPSSDLAPPPCPPLEPPSG